MLPMFDNPLQIYPDKKRVCLKGPIQWHEPKADPAEQGVVMYSYLQQDDVVAAVAPSSDMYLCPQHRSELTPDGEVSEQWWAVATVVGDGELHEGEARAIANAMIWTPAGWKNYEWEGEEDGRILTVNLEFPADGEDPYCG